VPVCGDPVYSERAPENLNMTSADRLPSRFVGSDFASSNAAPNLSSPNLGSLNTAIHSELQDRLGLYQVFLRLYENQRGLLDEILELETAGNPAFMRSTTPYIQGMAIGQQVTLITNLLHGTTQATTQPDNTWVIGRDSCRVNISLPDRRLSRCHAAVQYVEGKGFYLLDLQSSNGSYVNGELIQYPTLLKDGDRIRLGSLTFTFFLCQSTHSFQSVNPDVTENAIGCTPLTPFAQVPTEVELLENDPDALFESGSGINPLEDTCRFMRK
jgi:pSer/pThr/pTyr-binding forkhead associated (FHA) protein